MTVSTRLAIAGFCLLVGGSPALAAWTTTIESVADGQGSAAIMVGEADEGRFVQLWCRGDQRRLSILVNDGLNDDPSGISATVEIAADTGATWQSEGDFYRHDTNWLGLSYRNIGDLERIVQDIVNAQGNIAFSILPSGNNDRIYMTASADGSTKAGRAFADFCFGGSPAFAPAQPQSPLSQPSAPAVQPAAPAAQPAAPSQPASAATWTTVDEVDTVNGGPALSLVGDLGQGALFYANCSAIKVPMLGLLSNDPPNFPYKPGETNLRIRVHADAATMAATGEIFDVEGTQVFVLYKDPTGLERVIRKVAEARSGVAVAIVGASTTRWPAINLDGLQESAARFIEFCWG
ncbi:MAG TPA: hypothetical protein PK286_12730 [Devosia sp.]|nr:hypothetical protein [Devosia sp.]